uniref:Pentacotripeptide-repeat region of PRORP domain-containing protein n=1 Tax=Oryza glaberrima TaxID=4538 RepID=I1R3K2_ORYGL
MLGHLRRSSQRLPVANLAVYSIQSSHIEFIAGWCRNHSTRNFSVDTSNKVSNDRGYQSRELKPSLVKVIKWMLSKGQGKTIRTYEQLVCALEKDNRADEACRIWELKIAHDLQSVPWRFCHLMLGIYYRNNRLDTLVKLFKNLEACGRKPPSKDIVRKVEDTYEMLGLVEEKKELLEKYKELFDKPSSNDRKKGRQFKKAEKNTKTG